MPKLLSLLMMLSLALLLAGCTQKVRLPGVPFSDEGSYLPPKAGPGVVAAEKSYIPDVPMPIGFKPLPKRSSSSSDAYARTVHHVYQGHASSAEVVLFYRQHLGKYHWNYTGREQTDHSLVLYYTKGPEQLRIAARQRFGLTTITIDITGQGSAPAPAASP